MTFLYLHYIREFRKKRSNVKLQEILKVLKEKCWFNPFLYVIFLNAATKIVIFFGYLLIYVIKSLENSN